MLAPHEPLNLMLHLVIGADDVSYETGPLTFDQVVAQVRDGQYGDVHRVLSLMFADGIGFAEDVTTRTAERIFDEADDHPIAYGSEVYTFIERELSVWHAELCCSSHETIERRYEQRRDHMRRKA